jgi:hypothetical protein
VKRFADGFALGRLRVRWHRGICSPERQTRSFLLLAEYSMAWAKAAVQVGRASARLEVWTVTAENAEEFGWTAKRSA